MYGRPAMISRTAADISVGGFDAELHEGLVPHRDLRIRSLIYMNEMVKLHEVLDFVTVKYSKTSEDEEVEMAPTNRGVEKSMFTGRSLIRQIERGDFDDLLHSDAALSGWESGLPSNIKMPCADELQPGTAFDPRIDKQVVALRARFEPVSCHRNRLLTLPDTYMAVCLPFDHCCCKRWQNTGGELSRIATRKPSARF